MLHFQTLRGFPYGGIWVVGVAQEAGIINQKDSEENNFTLNIKLKSGDAASFDLFMIKVRTVLLHPKTFQKLSFC